MFYMKRAYNTVYARNNLYSKECIQNVLIRDEY